MIYQTSFKNLDCACNSCIPKSSSERIIIPPVEKTWINGLARQYGLDYPEERLLGLISKEDYDTYLKEINSSVGAYWPCIGCFFFGYCCALCTLGMSFLGPNLCMSEAKRSVKSTIRLLNNGILYSKGIEFKLEFGCSTSWIAIYLNKDLEII